MALDPVANFKKVEVSTGYDASATSIVLATGQGAKLPDPASVGAYNVVWYDATLYPDPADDPNAEIVRVTAKSSDTLTVTRNQEGSGASTKNSGGSTYKMVLGPTAKTITDIETGLVKFLVNQSSHGFAVGDWLYNNAGTYTAAQADDADTAEVVGVVVEVKDANNFVIQTGGKVTGLSGLTAGTVYFLSDSSAGDITATEPTAENSFSKPVLIADSTTSGVVVLDIGTTNANTSVDLQGAFDQGQTITIADGDNQTLTLVNNDTTNNPTTISIDNNGTGTGLYINQDGVLGSGKYGLYVRSVAAQTAAPLVFINLNNASATQPALQISQSNGSSTASALVIPYGGTGDGVSIEQSGTPVNNGHTVRIYSNVAHTNPGTALLYVKADNAGASKPACYFEHDGTGQALYVSQLGTGKACTINSQGGAAHLNLLGDPANSSPADGDLWYTGSALNFRDGSTTVDLLAGMAQAGDLKATARATASPGWLLCYGQAISRTDYDVLFAAIGTTWGAGDGTTTFNVPDFRGRNFVGLDNMGGVNANVLTAANQPNRNTLGGAVGEEKHLLTGRESGIQQHNHPQDGNTSPEGDYSGPGDSGSGWGHYVAKNTGNTGHTNAIDAHNTVPPGRMVNIEIKY